MKKKKRGLLALAIVIFLALAMVIIDSILSRRSGIFFQIDNSLGGVQTVVEESVERIKKRWNVSENNFVVYGFSFVNIEKDVLTAHIQLVDSNYIRYAVNVSMQQKEPGKLSVSVYNEGRAKDGLRGVESLWQNGLPTEKYQLFWDYMQGMYKLEGAYILQYYGIVQKRLENGIGERIYLEDEEAENYYCFGVGILKEDGTGDESKFFYLAVDDDNLPPESTDAAMLR